LKTKVIAKCSRFFIRKLLPPVFNIVESCKNDFLFDCADALISLFKIKYGDSDRVAELASLRQTKWNTIHAIQM